MFKLDTGAEATAISENTYSVLGKPNLSNPSKILYGPGEQQLNVLGQFESTLKCKQKSCNQAIFVVRGLKTNLLGLPAFINLNLAARLDATTDYDSLVQNKFPTLFQGLGNLGEPYTIQFKKDTTPHAIFLRETFLCHSKVNSWINLQEWKHKVSFQKLMSRHHGAPAWWQFRRKLVKFASMSP